MRTSPASELGSGVAAVLVAVLFWSTLSTTYALIQRHVAIDDVALVTLRGLGGALLAVSWFA